MKKIWLIAFVFNMALLWSQDFSAGTIISFRNFKGCFFQNQDSSNWAAGFSTKKFNLYYGNLIYSGSISLLNNPNLSSTTSPFSSAIKTNNPLNLEIPSTSRFTPKTSFFADIFIPVKNVSNHISLLFFPEFNSQKTTFSSNINTIIKINPKTTLSLNFLNGIFPYDELSIDSWFNNSAYYSKGNHFCSSLFCGIKTKTFSSNILVNTYQNPFNNINFSFLNQNKFKYKHLTFFISESFIPYDQTISSSDKKLTSALKLKTSLQYSFLSGITKPNFITTGFSIYADVPALETSKTLKVAFGIKLTNDIYNFSLISTLHADLNPTTKLQYLTNEIYNPFTKVDISIKNTFVYKNIKPSINFSAILEPSRIPQKFNTTEKLTFSCNFTQTASLNFTNTLELKQKTGKQNQIEFITGLSSKIAFKYISCSFKINYEIKKTTAE